MKRKGNIILGVTITTVASTLINTTAFGSASMAAYFLFLISASVLFVITGAVFITTSKQVTIAKPLPVFLFTGLVSYSIIHEYFLGGGDLNFKHTYLLIGGMLLVSLSILLSASRLNFINVCRAVAVMAAIESLICVFQSLGWLHSQNNFFEVTGTWVNPNVTAMFFVMAIPAMLVVMLGKKIFYKRLSAFVIVLIIISLVLLKCRTAFIGAFVAVAIVLNVQFELFKKLRARYSKLKLLTLAFICLAILLALGTYLYGAKQASADGRKLVWQISLNMIAEKPLGYGYGSFEHDYNLAQAKYFAGGSGNGQEITNATHVRMAYNEFLENGVEGGVAGVILFAAILLALLKPGIGLKATNKSTHLKTTNGKNNKSPELNNNLEHVASYAGIAAFAAMSLVNFTVQAIPAMCLFIVYAAVLVSTPSHCNSYSLSFSPRGRWLVAWCLIIPGLFLATSQLSLATAFISGKNAEVVAREGDKKKALNTLAELEDELRHSDTYQMNYARVLFAQKKYKAALEKFNEAKALTSDPEVYIGIGHCNYKLKQYNEARQAYQMAENIVPSRFAPRYALMKLYSNTKDTAKALIMANELIALRSKVESGKVEFYKKEAEALVNKSLGR